MAKVKKSNRRKTVKDEFQQTEILGGPSPLYTYSLLLLRDVWLVIRGREIWMSYSRVGQNAANSNGKNSSWSELVYVYNILLDQWYLENKCLFLPPEWLFSLTIIITKSPFLTLWAAAKYNCENGVTSINLPSHSGSQLSPPAGL